MRALETVPLSARLIVTDPAGREEREVDVLKETLWRPPVHIEHRLVLSLEDVVGTKVRALADRGLAGDLVDVQAAADRWSHIELEQLTPSRAPLGVSRPWSPARDRKDGRRPRPQCVRNG